MSGETRRNTPVRVEPSPRELARLKSKLFVSPGEAAVLMDIGRTTVYRMIWAGEIPVQYFRSRPKISVAWITERAAANRGAA